MSSNLDTQFRLFAPSGAQDGWQDGSGLSTRIVLDAKHALNNLLRTDLKLAYVRGSAPALAYKLVDVSAVAASKELYVGQFPILLAVGATRLPYAIGVSVFNDGGETDCTAVSIYVAAAPYTGAKTPTAFETSNLQPGYAYSSRPLTLAGASGYELADQSTVGIQPARPRSVLGAGVGASAPIAYAIVTVTGYQVSGAAGEIRVHDVSLWSRFD